MLKLYKTRLEEKYPQGFKITKHVLTSDSSG